MVMITGTHTVMAMIALMNAINVLGSSTGNDDKQLIKKLFPKNINGELKPRYKSVFSPI